MNKMRWMILCAAICVIAGLAGCSGTERGDTGESAGLESCVGPRSESGSDSAAEDTQGNTVMNPNGHTRILIIGNSHSTDAFWMLPYALNDLAPEQEIVLGVAYYSGCSITQHNTFASKNKSVYRYHKNEKETWTSTDDVTLNTMLQDQPWDVIMLQAGSSDLDATLNKLGRRQLERHVRSRVRNPYRLVWHTSWPSPNDEMFFSPGFDPQPPEGYKDRLVESYGFDPVNQFDVLTAKAKEHILTDDRYDKAICTGAAIMHAYLVQNCPQTDLWRDYTHLSDFGRLVAAYAMAAQMTGESVEAVSVEAIPAALRNRRFRKYGDLIITQEMKQIVIQAANHSLRDPWNIPSV